MRVLHILAYFPPDRIGGVGEVAAHLHRGLLAAGHESVVLTSGVSQDDPTVERPASSLFGYLSRLAGYARRASEFDLVHCHQGETVALPLAMKLRRVRTPVLATFHVGHRGMADACKPYRLEGRSFGGDFSSWRYRNFTSRLHRLTARLMLRCADAPSFISRSSAADLLPASRAAVANVIYNALPEPAREDPEPRPEATELLYVGTYSHRKRVLALPFVLQHVRASIPEARLRIIGFRLADKPQLRDLFAELGLSDAVISEGGIESSKIRPFYRASKVLVVPSAYEGLPMVILEAFQCGLPCVATRVSGHPEAIVDGETGFLVTPDDPRDMAQRCVEILSDPQLGPRMGENGKTLVRERFGLQRQIREYLDLYQRMQRGET